MQYLQSMQNLRGRVLIAWVLSGVVVVLALVNTAGLLAVRLAGAQQGPDSGLLFGLLPVLFAVPAALIISRQPRNVIGWLLMTPALVLVTTGAINRYLESFQTAPPPATLPVLLMVWFTGASWLALIFPLLLIPLYFPTGRLLNARWRWVVSLAVGLCLFFLFWAGFSRVYQPESLPWRLENPLGFLPEAANGVIMLPWTVMLLVMTAASLASTVARYRQATLVERQQMKWLLYACALFGLIYGPLLFLGGEPGNSLPMNLFNALLTLAIIAIPAAITAAILRYHLFDIDVIIRLTLVYAILTGLLGLVYAGGVVVLQEAFRILTGQSSDLAVVVTTLVIAALFNPLRQRIQTLINRRFYRQKYDADQALTEFASAARSSSDLDTLMEMLTSLVQNTLQPTDVRLYLIKGPAEGEALWKSK